MNFPKKAIIFTALSFLISFTTFAKNFVNDDYPIRKISEVVGIKLQPGIYRITGYVIDVQTCKECPKDASCAICGGDSIILSEHQRPYNGDITNYEFIFAAGQNSNIKVGEKYDVLLEYYTYKTAIDEGEMFALKLIKYNKIN